MKADFLKWCPNLPRANKLTYWGQVMHMSVKHTSIGSNIGLSPVRRQAIIWTNAAILLI